MRGQGRLFRHKKSRNWHAAFYDNGKEVRLSTGTEDRSEALAFLRKKLDEVHGGAFVNDGKLTVGALLDNLEKDYKINGRNARELDYQTRSIRKALGHVKARALNARRIKAYMNARLEKGIANATVNREIAALRRSYRLAVEEGLLASGHVPVFKQLREDNARQGFVSRDDLERICEHLDPVITDVARLAFLCSWRKGSVLSLAWRDIEFDSDGNPIGIWLRAEHNKTRRAQFLPLKGELQEIFQRRLEARKVTRPGGEYVLADRVFHRGGGEIRSFDEAWHKAREKAGLCHVLFHDLRRSGIRELVRAGVRQEVAMAISGHRTASVFQRYNILDDRDLADAMEKRLEYSTGDEAADRVVPMKKREGRA